MKSIKTMVLCLLLAQYGQGQTVTFSIADKQVAVQKSTLAGLLGKEARLLEQQRQLIRLIKMEEQHYQQKIGLLSNVSNSPINVSVQSLILSTNHKIKDIEYNISLRKFTTLGVFHGLAKQESEFKKLKDYFKKLERENQILLTSTPISGGAGHNYTAFLKLMVRLIKVRSSILELDKEVKSFLKLSRLLSK